MRHLMLIKINNEAYEAGEPPPPALETAMGKLMEDWTKAGVLVSAEGLLPLSRGARLHLNKGKIVTPEPHSGQVVGGFFIFKTKSQQQALELTHAFLALHQQLMGPDFECECELRALEG